MTRSTLGNRNTTRRAQSGAVNARAIVSCAVIVLGLPFIAGCPSPGEGGTTDRTRIQQLSDTVATQSRQIEMQREQIDELSGRLQRVQSMSPDQKLEMMPHVVKVQLATLSGGYDDNHDGIDDGIVLYINPVDQEGDIIKAAASAQVRLLNLAAEGNAQQVGQITLDVAQMRANWFGILGSHYTVKVPWSGGRTRPPAASITAVLSFQDYLTGKVFPLQQVFKVNGAGESATTAPATNHR